LQEGLRRTQNHYSRPITGRGFQIVLSRSFVGEAFPFISVLEVGNKIYDNDIETDFISAGTSRKP
jgi:hypothetical protein